MIEVALKQGDKFVVNDVYKSSHCFAIGDIVEFTGAYYFNAYPQKGYIPKMPNFRNTEGLFMTQYLYYEQFDPLVVAPVTKEDIIRHLSL